MKLNLPVTGREREMREGSIIVSKTDIKGLITFVNDTFCEISGFSREDLIGVSHNIVRHPDMPAEAFEDLWRDLKAGLPWTGIVKNRCKNGDHYWVSANVTPEVVDGRVVGYLSVRTKPSRATIDLVTPIYQAVREGRAHGLRIEHGGVAKEGLIAAMQRWNARQGARLYSYLAALVLVGAFALQAAGLLWPALAVLVVGLLLGAYGMRRDRNAAHFVELELEKLTRGQYDGSLVAGADRWGRFRGLLRVMQTKLLFVDVEARQSFYDNAMIRSAIDSTGSAIMIANETGVIVFCNKAMRSLFGSREAVLRGLIPGFDAQAIVGKNIDSFHRNPGHQRAILTGLKSSEAFVVSVGGISLRIIVTPVLDQRGKATAFITEWEDRTDAIQLEARINNKVVKVAEGDFAPMPEEGEGVLLAVSRSINTMLNGLGGMVHNLVSGLELLAHGDLTARLSGRYEGELKRLQDAFNDTTHKISTLLTEVRTSGIALNDSVREIRSGNEDLSQRTASQASALEEVASSLEEMNGSIQQNAEQSRVANDLAANASRAAQDGRAVVGQVMGTMNEISESSRRIADIIGIIDGIAFQTNILALNAAVEAARAGEQGRGFAVVASEVRSLAQRSSDAAREIRVLIQDSVNRVGHGSDLVKASEVSMEHVVEGIKQVADIMVEISSASTEQAMGIAQVNQAQASIDQGVQSNAAMVEQLAASAGHLQDQAQSLLRSLDAFRTDAAVASAPSAVVASTWSAPRPAAPRMPAKTLARAAATPSVKDDAGDWEEF